MDIPIDSQTAIVFDLDDTLYNEIEFLKSAYKELSKKLAPDSWQPLFSNLFSRYRNKENVFEYVTEAYGVSKEELLDLYRNHLPKITPFDGVIDLMNDIKDHEGKVGIITDGRSITQRNKIKALGIIDSIDFIVISEEIGTEKPNEKNYGLIEEALDCPVNYYIADNIKKDFVTPKRMGWKTICLIDNGLNIHSNAYAYQDEMYLPHDFISSIAELTIK